MLKVVGLTNLQDIRKKVEALRRHSKTGFSPAKGYDLRKPLTKSRIRTVNKYYEKLSELNHKPHVVYRPKRGEKREAFEYTGQTGYNKFDVAFVHKVNPESELRFEVDKSRPKGSRFKAIDKKTGQVFVHIPAYPFLELDIEEDGQADEFAEIIREYAPDAEFFLIEAGESYMWGAGGGSDQVGDKIAKIMRNYSADMFNAHNKRSSYYGNWFKGVIGFTNRFDAFPMINEARAKQRIRKAKYKITTDKKVRLLSDGSVGWFDNGELVHRQFLSGENIKTKKKRKTKRDKLRGR